MVVNDCFLSVEESNDLYKKVLFFAKSCFGGSRDRTSDIYSCRMDDMRSFPAAVETLKKNKRLW